MLEHRRFDTEGEREEMATSTYRQQVERGGGGRYQFVVQDTLQKSSPISENNEEECPGLLPQVVDPPTNLDPLIAMFFTVPNLNLMENGEEIVMHTPQ